jgi:hypothetical protein
MLLETMRSRDVDHCLVCEETPREAGGNRDISTSAPVEYGSTGTVANAPDAPS